MGIPVENIEQNADINYRLFIEKMNEGIIQVDKYLDIVYCNPRVCEIVGLPLESIVGEPMSRFLSIENKGKLRQEFVKRQAGVAEPYELEIVSHNQHRYSTLVYPHPFYDQNGEFEGSFSVIADISKLKKAENQLKQSEERYRLLIENLPVVVWRMDQNAQLIFISPNAKQVFGYTAEEIMARGFEFWSDQLHPDDVERVTNHFENLIRHLKSFSIEFRIYDKSGKWLWIHTDTNIIHNQESGLEVFGTFADITKAKQTEIAREQSEEKLKAVFNNHYQLTGLLTPDGVVLDMNTTALNFVGVSKNQVVGKLFWDTPWWNHDEQLVRDLKNAIPYAAQGHDVHFEVYHINKSGEKRYIDFTLRPVYNDNQIIYLIPEGHDFTEQRNITQSLYNNIKKYQMLFEAASDGILIFHDKKIMDCNKKALEIFECNREDIVGKSPSDFSPQSQSEKDSLSYDNAVEQICNAKVGEYRKFEWVQNTFQGNRIVLEVSLSCVHINNNRYVQAFHRDITEKKKTEQALIENENKYRNLVEMANDGVIILQDGKLQFINSSFLKMLGYTVKEAAGISMDKFIHPDDLKLVMSNYMQRMQNKKAPDMYSFRVLDKNGNVLQIEANVTRIEYQGKPASFAYVRNITERMRVQQKLAFTEKMSTIGELSRKVAHEIGNPLSSILHSASELNDTLMLQDDEQTLMDIILQETRRLDEIIKYFLKFSRPRVPVFQHVDMAKMLNELLMVFHNSPEIKTERITVHKHITDPLPVIVADRDMIKEVLWNILLNARDAIEGKGQIIIKAATVEYQKAAGIQLIIADTGTGVPAEKLDKIFEPYYTSKFSGSGLGLATVKRNIAEHDGQISVVSEINKGTEFTITLPVERG